MSATTFTYDYWRDENQADCVRLRDDWERRGLHWHCHLSRMSGAEYGNEAERVSPTSALAPKVIRDWLRKPTSTLAQVVYTPEEVITWLRSRWEPYAALWSVLWQPPEERFPPALYDLRCGNDLLWAEWINGSSTLLHTAIVGTSDGCHHRQ